MIPSKEKWYKALEERHGADLQKKISSATVAVCGLGGLGSAIATTLARSGTGRLILIDFDRVDITNLHRQQYKADQIGMYKTEALLQNIKEIAPYTEIKTYTKRLNEKNYHLLLKDADIICEAFDNPQSKAELVNFVLENMSGKPVVAASGMAGLGDANCIHTRRISDTFYLCGDEISDVNDDIGLVASRVMICAAHQAHTVLRILANQSKAHQQAHNSDGIVGIKKEGKHNE